MIIQTTEKRSVSTFLLAGSLLLLSGCFGEKKECEDKKASEQVGAVTDRGEVLLSIDGKPALYSQDFEDQKAMALQSDQRLQMIVQMVPNAEYDMIYKSIEAALVLKEWVHRQGIDKQPEFAKTLRQYQDAVMTHMCMQEYQKAHPITVTEKEAKEYYESHKDRIQGLAISSAGIDVLCATFDKKDEADRFLHKVKDGSKKHFEAAAKELHVTVTPMVVNEEGYADEVLKNVVLAATKFPSKDIIKMNDGSYAVIGMTGKKGPEYHSFDLPEVRKGITDMCMNEKRETSQLADVARFKIEFNVVEDKSYFEKKAEVSANIQKSLQLAQNLAMSAQQNGADDVVEFEEEIIFEDKI